MGIWGKEVVREHVVVASAQDRTVHCSINGRQHPLRAICAYMCKHGHAAGQETGEMMVRHSLSMQNDLGGSW